MNMNQKGFANIVLIVITIAVVAVGSYFIFLRQSNPPTKNQNSNTSETIQIKDTFEVLGFGKYIKNLNNVPYDFIDARTLTLPDATSRQYYKLCGSDENLAMSIFTKYLAYENHDIVLDDPKTTPEQKQRRMTEGYGTWHLVDRWKADTHYHYVIATEGESFWKHVMLEDCNYFTPTTEDRAITLGEDYSMPIGTFTHSPKTTESFLNFLQYYYGRGWTYIAENKLHSVSVVENVDTITISFKVAIVHSGDLGLPNEYTYHVIIHTLDKKTGSMYVSWKKTGARTSGHVDENLLK